MQNGGYNFRVRFDKDSHDIDTETYVKALASLTTIMKEANYQVGSGERVSINVVAEDKGSFDVGMVLKAVQDMVTPENVSYLANIVTVTTGLIALRRLNKKADESKIEINGDEVTIKDTKGDVIYVTNKNTYNIYTTNQVVQDALTANFKGLQDDDSISAFELNHDGQTVRVEREEFADMAHRVEVKLSDQEVNEVPANLVIVKLVFEDPERKWEFLYNGVKIGASIKDKNFWDEINGGKAFSKGDELVADLRIIREYDENVVAYVNKDYQLVNIREHHPRAFREQMTLEDIQ